MIDKGSPSTHALVSDSLLYRMIEIRTAHEFVSPNSFVRPMRAAFSGMPVNTPEFANSTANLCNGQTNLTVTILTYSNSCTNSKPRDHVESVVAVHVFIGH